MPRNKDLNSLDHEIGIKTSLILPAQLNINETSDNKLGSLFQGKHALWLKDSSTQGSEPFRHATELINESRGLIQTIFIKQYDGGADQNNTLPKVLLATIVFIVRLELIDVLFPQCAPR